MVLASLYYPVLNPFHLDRLICRLYVDIIFYFPKKLTRYETDKVSYNCFIVSSLSQHVSHV